MTCLYSATCGMVCLSVTHIPGQTRPLFSQKSAKNCLFNMSHLVGKPTMWFPNRFDTNRPVQLQKQDRSLKFWSYVDEELYYPSSENKGADLLRGYREADLRLRFRLCRLLVFPWGGSYRSENVL